LVGRKPNNGLVATPVLAKGHTIGPRFENDETGPSERRPHTPPYPPTPDGPRRDQELY